MGYTARIRFSLPEIRFLNIPLETIEITSDITIFSTEHKLISESTVLAIHVKNNKSQKEAIDRSSHILDSFIYLFSKWGISANFTHRQSNGFITDDGLDFFSELLDARVIRDAYGITVFEDSINPSFVESSSKIGQGINVPRLKESILECMGKSVILTQKARNAYDFYSLSFFQKTFEARFLMLMISMETLISCEERDINVSNLVNSLIDFTKKNSDISNNDKKSLLGSLEWLFMESIGQAGRRMAKKLGNIKYMGKSPMQFFTYAYKLRSNLIHGSHNPLNQAEISNCCSSLQQYVSDLIVKEIENNLTIAST